MTPKEASKMIKQRHCTENNYCLDNCMHGDEFCEYSIAIEALETISELEKRGITVDTINEYKIFEDEGIRKGFTFEILLEAREKQIPKKPDVYSDGYADGYEVWEEHCPNCAYDFDGDNPSYCPRCGQKIDWSKEE